MWSNLLFPRLTLPPRGWARARTRGQLEPLASTFSGAENWGSFQVNNQSCMLMFQDKFKTSKLSGRSNTKTYRNRGKQACCMDIIFIFCNIIFALFSPEGQLWSRRATERNENPTSGSSTSNMVTPSLLLLCVDLGTGGPGARRPSWTTRSGWSPGESPSLMLHTHRCTVWMLNSCCCGLLLTFFI